MLSSDIWLRQSLRTQSTPRRLATPQAFTVEQYNDQDILKLVLKRLDKAQMKQLFPDEENRKDTIQMYEHCYRQLQKSFSAYTAYLKQNVEKGLYVSCKFFGSFAHLKVVDASQTTKVCFMPQAETLS